MDDLVLHYRAWALRRYVPSKLSAYSRTYKLSCTTIREQENYSSTFTTETFKAMGFNKPGVLVKIKEDIYHIARHTLC
jgi:hypothetical protein